MLRSDDFGRDTFLGRTMNALESGLADGSHDAARAPWNGHAEAHVPEASRPEPQSSAVRSSGVRSSGAPRPGADGARADGEVNDEDLCDILLAALVAMAGRSKRRQADLSAAMGRAKLAASRERVMAALDRLERGGCVREIVPLYDGGVLVTVTNMGMDLLGRSAHWRFLQDLRLAPV